METTKNTLTTKQRDFFEKLRNYVDKPVYFYGSIQRNDYYPGRSDVDIAIFTENEWSTIYVLCNFLNLSKKDFKKSIYKLNNKIFHGYKAKYKDEDSNIEVEISLYNEKFKDAIMNEHSRNLVLPFYFSFVLIIIKVLYYDMGIVSKDFYRKCKRFIMNDNNEQKFILLDNI
jgi:predicted nucleotidyltransferase